MVSVPIHQIQMVTLRVPGDVDILPNHLVSRDIDDLNHPTNRALPDETLCRHRGFHMNTRGGS